MKSTHYLLLFLAFNTVVFTAMGQRRNRQSKAVSPSTLKVDISHLKAMKWRNIGPFRGGRSTAVAGVPGDIHTYYFGSTGGGVWKTVNGGEVWRNVSDGFFHTGSVGAIAVADSDPNVVYVGMGEAPIRGVMTSHGDGVYKSVDAGKSWKHIGLEKSRQISKVRIHPRNEDLVYVSVQGSPYQPTRERGIYRSTDGGEHWEQILFVNEGSGACDLSMDPNNPRILYAAFWDHQRLPWKMVSGGEGSSIWKSVDGGEHWVKLEKGLPADIMGKIGISVSPANPNRVWAIIEAEKGGLYRSDNGGKNWQLINGDRVLRARSWYYMHIFADPQDEDKVVVLNAPFMQSEDGGRTFTQISTPHGDNHDLWINPDDNRIMINANDGGANISYNGGRSWSTQANQPTAQFYRVNADHQFPYYVYGGQQDNSSVAIPSRVGGSGIQNSDFHSVGGCESAFPAFDPDNPKYVYAGCYQGIISRYDQETERLEDVMAYPFLGLGMNPKDMKYRFNWNAPILVSQHDPAVIYHAGNKVLTSNDMGQSWNEISPDLTRNEPEKIGWGGGPITNEGAGGENYHTIYYLAESPFDAKEIWAGADDGLLHITRDGGESWQNITPPNLEEGMINCIELSPFQPGKAYIAYNRYKFNDFSPYVLITEDYGKSWKSMVKGIGEEAHVRVVREDPKRKGLLYAGTETGLYVSFDGATSWQVFQLNLPVVPITDLKVHQGDLIAATQGRAFWILDDLSPLHQWDKTIATKEVYMYQPSDAYLVDGVRIDSLPDRGANPDNGLVCYYVLNKLEDSLELSIDFFDEQDHKLRHFSSASSKKQDKASKQAGMNKLVWNLRKDDYKGIKGVMNYGGRGGHKMGPAWYKVVLSYGKDTISRFAQVLPDPTTGLIV